MRTGDVAANSDFMTANEYRDTEFWQSWVQRKYGYLHEIGLLVDTDPAFSVMLFLCRRTGEPGYEARARDRLRHIGPHLRNILRVNRGLVRTSADGLAREVLARQGWAAIDHRGHVLLLEGPLTEALRRDGTLRLRGSSLGWGDEALQRRFDGNLARLLQDPEPRTHRLRVELADRILEIEMIALDRGGQVSSLGRTVVVLLDCPQPTPVERLRQLGAAVRVTSAEARVGEQLMGGEPVRAIAESLGISYETCRSHTKSLYTKLGVHSRGELAAICSGNRRAGHD